MKEDKDYTEDMDSVREKLLGLGRHSFRKSYYPELQKHIEELEKAQKELTKYKDRLEELVEARTNELKKTNEQLQQALSEIKTLSGLLPICASCKKIRDDNGYWNQIESYIAKHTDAEFTHGICPECAKKLYPDYFTCK